MTTTPTDSAPPLNITVRELYRLRSRLLLLTNLADALASAGLDTHTQLVAERDRIAGATAAVATTCLTCQHEYRVRHEVRDLYSIAVQIGTCAGCATETPIGSRS